MTQNKKESLRKKIEDLVYIYQDGSYETGFTTVDILNSVSQDMLKLIYLSIDKDGEKNDSV